MNTNLFLRSAVDLVQIISTCDRKTQAKNS